VTFTRGQDSTNVFWSTVSSVFLACACEADSGLTRVRNYLALDHIQLDAGKESLPAEAQQNCCVRTVFGPNMLLFRNLNQNNCTSL
jgi:hypothetical protein